MGAVQHKGACSPNSKGVLQIVEDVTPPRENGNPRRQLIIDPRSPTDDINRTPIVVEQTPSPNVMRGIDPRSPTEGIDRTPLTFVLRKETTTEPEMMEGEMLTEDDCIAPLCLPEATWDAEMTTPPKQSRSPDPDDIPGIPDIDAEDGSFILPDAISHTALALMEPTPMKTETVTIPKQLFSNAQRPLALKLSSAPRSPLGLVAMDTNSPRNIVQTKQRRHVTKSLGGGKPGRTFGVDKENLIH